MRTLNDAAIDYANACIKTGDAIADLAAAFLDGYYQAQLDLIKNMPVPAGNKWWFYDAQVLPGGFNKATEETKK